MAITQDDIAREAGVNASTVSRALSDAYGVRKEVRQKILAVARRLDYRPNLVARRLATGRSHSLGLVISDIRNPFFAELTRGAEDAANAAGYDVVLCNSDLEPAKQMGYVRSLIEKRVDAMLLNSVSTLNPSQQRALADSDLPIVLLNRTPALRCFSTVLADNFGGGFLAGQYLAELGHRKIAHLTGPRQHGNFSDRARGFLKGVREVCGKTQPIVIRCVQNYQGAYDAAKRLLHKHPGVTAVFAASDAIAFGVIHAALEAGVRIPDDISVVGFDDVEFCSIVHPPLTTIRQPKYEMGRAAVEIMIKGANTGNRTPEHRVFGVELIQRQSCRAL